MSRPLVVVALRQEAVRIVESGVDADVVITGPGKVSAALATAAAIAQARPPFVVNAGTAGALRDGLDGAHTVGRVVEHDFDHDGLEALLGERLPGEIVLDDASAVVLATGDRFVQEGGLRAALATRADLVDMEGYAVARACRALEVPCQIVKVVSDDASEGALRSWQERVDHLAHVLADEVAARLA